MEIYCAPKSNGKKDESVHERIVENGPKGANSPTEFQHLAQKLADLAEQIKTITATPIGETVYLHESDETSHQASLK